MKTMGIFFSIQITKLERLARHAWPSQGGVLTSPTSEPLGTFPLPPPTSADNRPTNSFWRLFIRSQFVLPLLVPLTRPLEMC